MAKDLDTFPLSRRRFLLATGVVTLPAQIAHAQSQDTHGPAPAAKPVQFHVNGSDVSSSVDARVTLLDYLRDQLDLTGTKKGCNEGACGTCTVLVDGKRMNACLTLVAQCAGRQVTTIEGIGHVDNLHPVQTAFIEHDAFQCGYCTPGQIVSAVACISEGHATDADTVREFMSGNICRCAAYPQITAAVLSASERMKG